MRLKLTGGGSKDSCSLTFCRYAGSCKGRITQPVSKVSPVAGAGGLCSCILTVVLPLIHQGEEAAPSLESERADTSTRSYSTEELPDDFTKSDQARFFLPFTVSIYSPSAYWVSESFILCI